MLKKFFIPRTLIKPKLKSEQDILRSFNSDPSNPVISICCVTYNHEGYIKEALHGFLMQETTYPYEILIHDDASTDHTQDIIREYEQKYPSLIKPIYQIKNQKSKLKTGINPKFNFLRAKGKYIAVCDGDDHWIDPKKLQKQVDLLESDTSIGIVHTNCIELNTKTNERKTLNKNSIPSGSIFIPLLIKNLIHTVTAVARADLLVEAYRYLDDNYGADMVMDYSMWLYIAYHKNIAHLQDITAEYRITKNSASRPDDLNKQYAYIQKAFNIRMMFSDFAEIDDEMINSIKLKYFRKKLYYAFKNKDFESAKSSVGDIRNINGILNFRDILKYAGAGSKFIHVMLRSLIKDKF